MKGLTSIVFMTMLIQAPFEQSLGYSLPWKKQTAPVVADSSLERVYRIPNDPKQERHPHYLNRITFTSGEFITMGLEYFSDKRPLWKVLSKPKNRRAMGRGFEIIDRSDPNSIENDPSVNCHGYSTGHFDLPGFPPRYWLYGQKRANAGINHPMTKVLKMYFKRVAILHPDTNILDGEYAEDELLVVFRGGVKGRFKNGIKNEIKNGYKNAFNYYIHSGVIIQREDGEFWLLHKLGQSPAVFSQDLSSLHKIYPHTQIELWRLR